MRRQSFESSVPAKLAAFDRTRYHRRLQTRTPAMDATELARSDGVCKTVYSIYWPFTRDLIDRVWKDERDTLHRQYEEAWTKKQDALHDPFLEDWAAWATPLRPPITRAAFPYRYPTSGSSEALRETLADFAANRRGNALHVFVGEYE